MKMIRILLFLIILNLNLNALTLKQYLLQYCSNHNLTLVYDVSINPQIFPVRDFNFLDLSKFYNITFRRDSHFLIVTSSIDTVYIFNLPVVDDNILNSIFNFLNSLHFVYSYSNYCFRVVSSSFRYKSILLPFFRSFYPQIRPIVTRTKY